MNTLESALQIALSSQKIQDINKVYLEFMKANFLVPVEKGSTLDDPKVLFFSDDTHTFMPAFTQKDFLSNWARDIETQIDLLTLSGVNLLQGIGENVSLSLNLASPLYKTFLPAELMRMKNILIKMGLVKTTS